MNGVRRLGIAGFVLSLCLAVGFVVVMSTVAYNDGEICDGSQPVWVEAEGGCAQVPRLWDHFWPPDHWFAPSRCIGLCQAVRATPTPYPEPTIEMPDTPLSVEGAEIGGTYPVAIWLLCGNRAILINGDGWTHMNHPHDEQLGRTGEGFDEGTVTIVDADSAIYTSSNGVELTLDRGGEPPIPCF